MPVDGAGGIVGIVDNLDLLADEAVGGLVETAFEAHGAVAGDAALGLHAHQAVEVLGRRADALGVVEETLERRAPTEPAVGALVILALEPGPEDAVQGREVGEVVVGRMGQKGRADVAEKPFNFTASPGLAGAGMDEGDPQGGTDYLEMLVAIQGAVVAVKPPRNAAALEGLFQGFLKASRAFRAIESGEGNETRGVVEKRVEIGLGAAGAAGLQEPRAVHHVGHPQIPDVGVGEGAGVASPPSPAGGASKPWASKSRRTVDGARRSSAGTRPESRTARIRLSTEALGRLRRSWSRRCWTVSGIARLVPRSERVRGLRPSKPMAS